MVGDRSRPIELDGEAARFSFCSASGGLECEAPRQKEPPLRAFRLLLVSIAAMLACASRASAAESYASCTGVVSSIPTVIGTAGTWCLKQNLSTALSSTKAITINADNVTVDCNHFALSESAGLGNTAFAIYALNRHGITLRHCAIRGFRFGAYFIGTSSGGHRVESNHFVGETAQAIRVEGDGSLIQANQVLDTGGSTVTTSAYGIYVAGSADILDNLVDSVLAHTGSNGSAYGIYTSGNVSGTIALNRVRGLVRDGTGRSFGNANASSGHVNVHDNDLLGDATASSIGLSCTNATGRAKANTIGGFGTALQKCGDGTGNTITP